MAQMQHLSATALPLENNPFNGLIRVHEINALRGFGDHSDDIQGDHTRPSGAQKLTEQLRPYYSRHLDPGDSPDVSDIEALRTIEAAQSAFDAKQEAASNLRLERSRCTKNKLNVQYFPFPKRSPSTSP